MQYTKTKKESGSNYRISIIIPTFNGGQWIESGVRSIAEQLKDIPYVEFLVRDNASTDNTYEIIQTLQLEYPSVIKYDRRETNTPYLDQNFCEAINMTSGEYILLVGDDDALMPYSVSYLLHLIEKYPSTELFYFNRLVANYDFSRAYLRDKRKIDPVSVNVYQNVSEFLSDHINGPDFITVNLIKREAYNRTSGLDVSKYYGYNWYARYLFGVQNSSIVSIQLPLAIQRLPQKRSWGKQSVLYALVGLSNLLQDIDTQRTIYRVWMDYLHQKGRLYITLLGLTHNRPLYKQKYREITKHLNKKETLILWLLLYVPHFKYVFSSVLIISKKINLI